MNYLVIYPGRFHPFHRGHRASYEYLAKKYGADHVYIATTGVQAPVTSPFTFADKVQMISTLGIPAGHVVKVSNPYQSREITDSIPAEEKANTVLIFALSAKDAERFNFAPKRDGTASYLQPMPDNVKRLKPMTEHAYVEIVPTVNFKVRGKDANSASQIREFYIKGNNNDRDQIIADLYGEAYPELRDIFDERLGVTEQVQKIVREAK
jgi:FAD synthase